MNNQNEQAIVQRKNAEEEEQARQNATPTPTPAPAASQGKDEEEKEEESKSSLLGSLLKPSTERSSDKKTPATPGQSVGEKHLEAADIVLGMVSDMHKDMYSVAYKGASKLYSHLKDTKKNDDALKQTVKPLQPNQPGAAPTPAPTLAARENKPLLLDNAPANNQPEVQPEAAKKKRNAPQSMPKMEPGVKRPQLSMAEDTPQPEAKKPKLG